MDKSGNQKILHDRTGRLETKTITLEHGVKLHDRTGRLENISTGGMMSTYLHDRTGRLENNRPKYPSDI